MSPPDLKYSEEHEWVRVEPNGIAIIGITEFAASELGDVVFVELPERDTPVVQFAPFAELESVKAVSEIYAPVSGRVIERNERIADSPGLVNESPYQAGWLIKVAMGDPTELEKLMTAEEYDSFVAAPDS